MDKLFLVGGVGKIEDMELLVINLKTKDFISLKIKVCLFVYSLCRQNTLTSTIML